MCPLGRVLAAKSWPIFHYLRLRGLIWFYLASFFSCALMYYNLGVSSLWLASENSGGEPWFHGGKDRPQQTCVIWLAARHDNFGNLIDLFLLLAPVPAWKRCNPRAFRSSPAFIPYCFQPRGLPLNNTNVRTCRTFKIKHPIVRARVAKLSMALVFRIVWK